jgi:predicted DNA-binding transcriptional regulator AlpA
LSCHAKTIKSLRARLTAQTVYNRISIGNSASLPKYIKLGSLVRFPLTEVEAWIALQINDAQLPKLDPLTIVRRRGRPSKAEQIARRSIQ